MNLRIDGFLKTIALPLGYPPSQNYFLEKEQKNYWSGRRDLNPRPPEPESDALPLRYAPKPIT